MNIFKINSQGLIKSQVDEDVFNSIISGEDRVFSMQRFATPAELGANVNFALRQSGTGKFEGASTTFISKSESLTGVLSAYTLGRTDDPSSTTGVVIGTAGSSGITIGSNTYFIAPLSDGTNVYRNDSYKMTAYYTGAEGANSKVQLAFSYKDLPIHMALPNDGVQKPDPNKNYMIGFTVASNTGLWNDHDGHFDNSTGSNGELWSNTYSYPAGYYTSTYKSMVNGGDIRQGDVVTNKTSSATFKDGTYTISMDFFDVSLSNTTLEDDTSGLYLGGAYVYRGAGADQKSIDFLKETTGVTFDDVDAEETETYKINGVDVKVIGGEKKDSGTTFSMTVDAYNTTNGAVQTFSNFSALNSDVSVSFSILGNTSGVSLNGTTYKNSAAADNTGTVMFGVTSGTTQNFITLGTGSFALAATDGTLYNLSDNASATFALAANRTYMLDIDGANGDTFKPMSIVTAAGAGSLSAIYGSSNISLAGTTFTIGDSSGVTYILSDTSAAATISVSSDATDAIIGVGLFGTDASKQLSFTGSSGASVQVAYNNTTGITLGGTFSAVASTDPSATVLGGYGFTLNDSTTAVFAKMSVSDTANGETSYIGFTSSDTATLGGKLSFTYANDLKNITFTMSDGAVVTATGTKSLTFSDTASGGATFAFTDATKIALSGNLAVLEGSDATVLNNYTFTVSDTGAVQLGAISVSDTQNSSETTIQFSANTASDITISGGGASINFGQVAGSSVYTAYTYSLTELGDYSINSATFTVNTAGTDAANKVQFTGGDLVYSGTHSDTAFKVSTESDVTGYKIGANITVGSETVAAGSAKLFDNIYVGATKAEVSYQPVAGSDVAVITGDGFEISAVDTSDYKTLVGIDNYTFNTGNKGVFFVKDGGSGLTIANATGGNALTFNEVEDKKVTKLELTGTNALSVTGGLVLTSGSDVATTYALNAVGTDTSSIGINGITFAGYDATVANAKTTYTLQTSDSHVVSITGNVAADSTFKWNSKSYGEVDLGGISIALADNASIKTGFNIEVASNTTLQSNTSISSSYKIATKEMNIVDASGSATYKVNVGNEGKVLSVENIDNGAVLTKVGGASEVHVNGAGTYTFKTSGYITSGTTKTQAFSIESTSTDVTFVLSSDTGDLAGTVVEIKGLGNNAKVVITDTTIQSGTYALNTNVWEKTVNGSIARNNAPDSGKWGATAYMGYIADQASAGTFTLTGIGTDTAKQEETTFASDTIASETGGVLTIVGSDVKKVPVTFKNEVDGTYSVSVSDTALTLFTGFGKTSGDLGVQATADENGTYSLTLVSVPGADADTMPASYTTKSAIADGALSGLTLSANVPLKVYEGFEVSGTSVSVAANSETVTVTGAVGSEAYIGMSNVSDTVTFGALDASERTYKLYNGKAENTLIINTDGDSGKALASNTSVFALNLSDGASVKDTITSAEDSIAINGVTYSMGGDAAVTYTFTGNTKNTLEISGGIMNVSDSGLLSDTTIQFTGLNEEGLILNGFKYTAASDTGTSGKVAFEISVVSDTQKATMGDGSVTVKEEVEQNKAFIFNDGLYTATSKVASILLETGSSDKFLADTTATGKTNAEKEYVVSALSDTYTMAAGAGVTLVYSEEAAYSDTFAKTTFTSGSGTFKTGATKFHLADSYLGKAGTDTTIYEYTASETGKLSTMTLNMESEGSETISLGTVIGTREASSDTTKFSFAPYSEKSIYEYTKTSTDTLTFSINSETAATYGSVGVVTDGVGIRTLTAENVGEVSSDTTLAFNSDTYSPGAGATMTLVLEASKGTETFTAGTGTFTAAAGEAFHFALNGTDVNVYSATSAVELTANFSDATTAVLVKASGEGTRLADSETHAIELLSNTYIVENAVMTLKLAEDVTSSSETFTSGSGTLKDATTFALSDEFLAGVKESEAKAEGIFEYTGKATLGMTLSSDGKTTLTLTDGSGTRTSNAVGESFTFKSKTYTSTDSMTYMISAETGSATKAFGTAYSGAATREFESGETDTAVDPVVFNSDTYTITGGTIGLTLVEGADTETFVSGSATYEASATSVFHYALGSGTAKEYTALDKVTLGITRDESNTTLVSAEGTGLRAAESETFAISALGGNEYKFNEGQVKLEIASLGAESETAYNGTGTFSPTEGVAIAQFDATGSATGTVYSYTKFADATFEIKLGSGTVVSQTLTAGSATRRSDSGEDFTYEGKSYTAKGSTAEASSMTFVLSADNAATYGAAGGIFSGVGYRTDSDTQSYTVSETQNVYASVKDAEMKLTLTDGVASETMFNATASETFVEGKTFKYQGTQYTAKSEGVVLKLNLVDGAASETGVSGTGSFVAQGESDTFTYESNEYTATSGTELAVTFGESGTGVPKLVRGSGHRALADGDEFTYTDTNVYKATANGELSVEKAEGAESVTTTFSAGKGLMDSSKTGGQFYFTLGSETYLYSDTGKAQVEITGSETGATVALISGTAERTASGTDLTFTFDSNTYKATSEITFTLSSDSGTALETATGGKGQRTVSGEFTYKSPTDKKDYVYTANNVVLEVELKGTDGTETFKSGTATRNVESGTFTYAAADLGGESATYNGSATYELTLTDTSKSESGMLNLMGYNVDVVTETLKQASGTTEKSGEFAYKTIVTGETNTYTADGSVTFELKLENNSETVTWQSGTAKMSLEDGVAFNYQADNAENAATYTVKTSATFNREKDSETFVSGDAFRYAANDEKFKVDFNSDTYNAAASSTIVLKVAQSGTAVNEVFDAGSATFTAEPDGKFHYTVDGKTREYTATDRTTLQVGVENGSATSVISAEGAGKRGFEETETTTHTLFGTDNYEVSSGTFTLTLNSETYTAPSETLTQGSGVYDAKIGAQFTVTDKVLGISEDSTTYTYSALSETKLNLTIADGVDKVAIEKGFGTRSDNAGTFTFKGNAYKADGELAYSINDSSTKASGDLYSAIGSREVEGAEASGTTVFNSDTYTVDKGVLTVTVTGGEGEDKLTSGTATYVAAAGQDFHFSTDVASRTYKAISESTLQISVTDETNTSLFAINAQGTRAAESTDESLTTDYLGDTYHATTQTTVLFTATGDPAKASESVYSATGVVVSNVEANKQFHILRSDTTLEYTAGSSVTIALALTDSVQTFESNPNATRKSTDYEFELGGKKYQAYDGVTYMYSGTGVASSIQDKLWQATGYRSVAAGTDTRVSTLGNTYALTSGAYDITVSEGVGTETLTSGAGSATFAAGTTFYYGNEYESATYTAQDAVLNLSTSYGYDVESLVSGAGYDSVGGRYILATDSTLNASAVGSGAPVSVSGATSGVVTLGAADSVNGITSLSSGDLNATVTSSNKLKVNGKTYSASDEGVVTFNTALNSATAGTGSTVTAEGDFENGSNPTLAGGQIGVANDSDVAVTFDTTIKTLDKLSNGVTVSNAAGATKAITDTEGLFNFSKNNQAFKVTNDAAITFQLNSDGLVTGIAGIDAENAGGEVTIAIQDGDWSSEIKVTELGKVLNRNEDGSWADGDVDAVAYGIRVDSDGSVFVAAVDAQGDDTRIKTESIATTVATDTGKVTITLNDEAVGGKPIMLVNDATSLTVDLPGHVTGIGAMNGAAIQLDSDTSTEGAFKTGTLNGTKFTSNGEQTITGATFDVMSDGAIIVNSQGDAKVAVSDTSRIRLLADTNTDKFTINDGPEMTLAIGTADTNGVGTYTLQASGTAISGLTPSDVQTGTVVIPTSADGTTFAINSDSVTVTNDNDGMRLEVYSDTLVGVSDISTAATVTASSDVSTLSVNGDAVTLTSDPIKYNATNEKWLSGPAPAAEGVIGYLIQVNANNTVSLSYQTSDTIKATTNVADYNVVFADSGYAPDEDGGALKPYGSVIELNTLGSDISVSVAADNNNVAVNVKDSAGKALILTSANATYTINEQQIIPSAQVTVFAQSDTALATVNAATSIQHGEMTFDATTDSAVLFTPETIYLNNKAHVTNTESDKVFNVNGTVQFDSAVVVAGTSESGTTVSNVRTVSASVSGMTVNDEELNIAGGDLAYTLNVAGSDTVISGISSPATVSGTLANNAQILTDSTGTYQVGTDTFTISGDSAVAFKTTNGAVTAIDSLAGTATGNFNGVSVDGKSILIYNDVDSVQAVTANGENNITDITGVGNANTDVVVANAGGATLISTDANGGIYFGAPDSNISSKHYTVNDADSVVSFLTSGLEDYTPSVSGVQGLEDGNIAISQAETGFAVNAQTVNLTDVSSDVTLNVTGSEIVSVSGLTGGISGLESGVAVEITDSDVTVNGSQISIYEPNETNVIYTSTVSDTVTTNVITGLNTNAVVHKAANMNILTEQAGTFTFNNGVYTISGDENVTFETDNNSNVKNVADVVGTVQSSASNNTINGAAVSSNDTDVTIVAASGVGSGVSSVLGAKAGDSIKVPDGTAVEIAGSSDPTVASAFTVNGKEFAVTGDTDTVVYTPGSTDSISGLAPGASLRAVNTAGMYNVNGSDVYASVGAVIIGDEEGTAHVYDPSDVNISADDTPEQVIEKVTGGKSSEDKYVAALDSDAAKVAVSLKGSALDGNLELELGGGTGTSSTDSVETADFSNSKGIKKAKMNGEGNQNVKFNDEGGNIAVVGDYASGEKNVSMGDGGDLAVIGKTGATTNIKAGRGSDSVISQGKNVKVDVSAGGPTKLMANSYGASMEVEGYDANTGAGIQTTNSDIKAAVKKNTIGLENGKVTMSDGAAITTDPDPENNPAKATVVNLYNLKGLMTKVGYTYNEGGGTVDLSNSKNDVVMKGNYQEFGAQAKKGSKLISGSGDDYVLAGVGDDIDVGEGNNEIELSSTARQNGDSGAVISQTATRGKTKVTGFTNGFDSTGDRVNVSATANVRLVGTVLTFVFGAAQLILNNVSASGNSSADLAESADEDDNATALEGTINYAPVMIGDATSAVKTAVASEGNWIGGSDALWTEDNMPSAYVGENSGISFLNSDGALDLHLGAGNDGNGTGTLGGQGISVRGISKVRLGSGPSTVYGAATTNNTIVTGLGNGSVWGGGSSNDTFIGRQTSLKFGESTFFYVDGDGKDTISNFEFLTGENRNTADVVNVLGTSVTGASTSGNDVIVNLARSEDDRLTIKDAAGKDFIMEYGNVGAFETLVAQVNNNTLTYDNRATYYQATGRNAMLNVDSGLDSAEVWLNNNRDFSTKTFVGDISVLNASGVQGASTLVGNGYNNSIVGSAENSSMWGGSSHETNDTLVGGAGSDMFWYGKNEGNDVVSSTDENDVINLYNVNIADVESYDNWNITNNSISFNLKDGGSLTIQSNNSGVGFKFADDGNTYAIDQRTKQYYTK